MAADQNKIDLILFLADTNLLLSQRNAEWCGHGPVLEQDIALTNIALDTLGQARNFYQYAALLMSNDEQDFTEDRLAYHRDERSFKNLLITELPKGDWGFTILRQYLFSVYAYNLYEHFLRGDDHQLAAIAEKSVKELKYHISWSREWVLRLGDGTEESHSRMQKSLQELWPYTGEMFLAAPFEDQQVLDAIKVSWQNEVASTLNNATLNVPENIFMQSGGKSGIHTEHAGYVLAEMQYLQRMHPDAEW